MYGDGLVVFGVFWVGLGYFEAVGFQKRNLAQDWLSPFNNLSAY